MYILTQHKIFKNPESIIDFHWFKCASNNHNHDYFELLVIFDGNFTHQYKGKTINLSKGDMVLITPSFYHNLQTPQESSNHANFSISTNGFSNLTKCFSENCYDSLIKLSGTPYKLTRYELEYLNYMLNNVYSSQYDSRDSSDYYYISIFHWLLGIMYSQSCQNNALHESYPKWLEERDI